ncbi:MAG: DnaJ C-terminal domain-containing protein [Lachnospiraceae bacterium]|nr:DnaJ C-terminal domain-containing protein [Lachnospiraceae bacterium]
MTKKKDYYETLGVKKTSTEKEIKSAYRKLAKKYHPDTNANNKQAEQKFKEVTEAYNVLSDKEKRKLYDRYGFAGLEEGFDPNFAGYSSGFGGFNQNYTGSDQGTGRYSRHFSGYDPNSSTYREFHFTGSDGSTYSSDEFEDLFRDMFSGQTGNRGFTGESRSAGFGRRKDGSTRNSRRAWGTGGSLRGSDLTSDLTVSFDESLKGCSKMLRLSREDGSFTTIQVSVPAGIQDGKTIRLKGKGHPGMNGGEAGDLLLQVHVTPRKGWERKGNDLYVTAEIPFETAVLGGEAIIPTMTGNVSCKIKAGTRSGSKIRLRGKGVSDPAHPSETGDEYAVIQIEVPRNLSSGKLRKLKEYADA